MKKKILVSLFIAMLVAGISETVTAQIIVDRAGRTRVVRSRPVVVRKYYAHPQPRYYRSNRNNYYWRKHDNGRHRGWYKHRYAPRYKRFHH